MTAIYLLFLFYLLVQCLALVVLWRKEVPKPGPNECPEISIWIAARNEEDNILNCLQSIAALDYPKDRIQVLVGDDQSDDRTAELVRGFIAGKPEFELVSIEGQLGKARKKANVLAHLAHHSRGSVFLICDADIRVKPTWAKELVSAFEEGTGVVSATTLIQGPSWFARLQKHDWLYFMGLIKSAAVYGIPCTAVGNNMAISSKAYWTTGGYENIDFSITEDYKLFREVIERNFGWKHLLSPGSTSFSAPAPDWATLMKQRKRWLEGGKELPLYWKLLLGLYGAFNPLILLLFFLHWPAALLIVGMQVFLQSVYLILLLQRIHERISLLPVLLYTPYSMAVSLLSGIYFAFPAGKEWKGRTYP